MGWRKEMKRTMSFGRKKKNNKRDRTRNRRRRMKNDRTKKKKVTSPMTKKIQKT